MKIGILLLIYIIISLGGNFVQASSNPQELIQQFDISSYVPFKFGLKDLVVDVRITGLLKQLNEKLIFGNMEDVYFRLSWVSTGKFDIEIYGMPKGFNEIKTELIKLVQNRIDFIIPKELGPLLKNYNLNLVENQTKDVLIKAVDPDHVKYLYEMELLFDEQSRLKKLTTFGPMGMDIAEFLSSKKSWSQNKWVVDQITVKSSQGIQSTSKIDKITYEVIEGIGLPKKVESKVKQTLLQPTSQNKDVYKREIHDEIIFSNYKVNSGEAQLYLQKK